MRQWRYLYMKPPKRYVCHNCSKVVARYYCRKLCGACWRNPVIRVRFPAAHQGKHNEPTEEELEAMIAEQMKNLPAWWPKNGQPDMEDEE